MKHKNDNFEEDNNDVYNPRTDIEKLLDISNSVKYGLVQFHDKRDEFMKKCRDKYGDDVKFCIEFKIQYPYRSENCFESGDIIYNTIPESYNIEKRLLLSCLNPNLPKEEIREVYYIALRPMLNNVKMEERYLISTL